MTRAMRKISAPSSARAGLRPPTATTRATNRTRFSSMLAAARSARADAGVDGGRLSRLPVATFGLRRVRNELAVMIMRNVRITEPRVRWLRVMGRSVVRGPGERHGAYARSPLRGPDLPTAEREPDLPTAEPRTRSASRRAAGPDWPTAEPRT